MRHGLDLAAAAAFLIAAPASAGSLQSTDISSQGAYIEGPGVGIRVGPGMRDRDNDRDRRRGRHWRDREVRGERGDGCKRVTVRETRPDGSVVTRTRTNC